MPDARLFYRIQPVAPEAHLFAIEMRVPATDSSELRLSLPAWIPGSYMIRDFAKHLVTLNAVCDERPMPVRKLDKQTWQCSEITGPLIVRYEVYAWDLSVRAAHLDGTHGYFNGPCVFLAVQGLETLACDIEILAPAGGDYAAWKVATTLEPRALLENGFGHYLASDYADLIDHPVEMGCFNEFSFHVRGVTHRFAITGRHRVDGDRLCEDVSRICEQHVRLFGELPLQRYLFLVTAVGDGYGGLEHRDCASLICKRDDLPRPGESQVTDGYRRFLALCSHEYFHLWNVKRIRPRVFADNRLDREVYTRLLWAFEGITSYYDELALVRSGCIDQKSYLQMLAEGITRVMRNPGRFKQSLAESSFDAWTKFYKQDENAPNAIVSYYTKGALVALTLDLTLRQRTADAWTLDDLMRALWHRYGKRERGVPEDGVEQLAQEITGLDLQDFFDRAVRGTEDLELGGLLAAVGIEMRLRPQRDDADNGGVVDAFEPVSAKPTLGIRLVPKQVEPAIALVLEGTPAQRAGLSAGDTLVAIGGLRATPANWRTLLEGVPSGEQIEVCAFRRDELMTFLVTPLPAPADTCELRVIADASDEAVSRRGAWLGRVGPPDV
jgi:predicted metalloprotease with PDZ domain